MAPGLPKKPNRSSFQAQQERASALLKKNTLLAGPCPIVDSSQEQGKKTKFFESFQHEGINFFSNAKTDEAFFETLGTGHGYIKGLGYGPTPPSARKTYLETDNAELRDLNNKLVEENQQLKEKCVELQDNVNDLKARQAAIEAKQVENDARQAENDARQAASDVKQAEMEKMLHALMARNS